MFSKLKRILPIIGLIAGICILGAYPALDLYYAYLHANEGRSITRAVSELKPKELETYRKQAEEYNTSLVTHASPEGLWPYESQLAISGTSASFAEVVIPKISLDMPIYHGTDEETLMNGVGHLKGSSLPVGGKSTHAILTAHSGMNGMRAFDDIRQLENGDEFFIKVLGKTLAYKVYSEETLWPDEAEERLGIEDGKDIVTLVTCTPYGVNDHRLLVHGERVPYKEKAEHAKPQVTKIVTNRRYGPFIFAVALVIILIVISILKHKKKSH